MSVSSGFPWLLPFSLPREILPDGVLIDKRRLRGPIRCTSGSSSGVISLGTPRLRHAAFLLWGILSREEDQRSVCSGAPMSSCGYFCGLSSLGSCSPESFGSNARHLYRCSLVTRPQRLVSEEEAGDECP